MTTLLVACVLWVQDPTSTPAATTEPAPATPGVETVHAFLMEYDADKDGVLIPAELPERLQRYFIRADLDKNGQLDARELLIGPTRISREARRTEDLRITRRGLERRHPIGKPDAPVDFRVPTTLLQRLDQDHDGYVDAGEIGTLLGQPGVVFGDRDRPVLPIDGRQRTGQNSVADVQPPAEALPAHQPITNARPLGDVAHEIRPPSPFDPVLIPELDSLPTRPDAADPIAEQGLSAANPADAHAEAPSPAAAAPADALPDAESILEHLDKNGNGQLDRSEAVDQLADNFDRLDKNRDNMLSDKEIKRGLFLARMLGIKPKQDPNNYRSH